jgi:transcriptional regulator with GAF, ATPase, and Fis domain
MKKNAMKSPEGLKRFDELLEYFDKGKVFTEELMKENERLRIQILKLEKEKMDLKSRVDPVRMNELLEENRKLRARLEVLEARFDEIEKENKDFAQRYVEVTSQNDNLLNLYVSSYQLHSTLEPCEVVNAINEIILNLIGAEEYYIYMKDPKKPYLTIVSGEGPDGPVNWQEMEEPQPILEKVLNEGTSYFRKEGENGSPYLACTPLKVKEDVIGVISINKLMDQKTDGFTTIDLELLNMLADHAATALVSSDLHSKTQRKLKTVESFIELLKIDRNKE